MPFSLPYQRFKKYILDQCLLHVFTDEHQLLELDGTRVKL